MRPNKSMVSVVIVMALVSFMCLSLSVSYSYVLRTKTSSNTVSITTDNLNSTITYGTSYSIKSMSDEDGLALTSSEGATISVSKNNNYTVYYSINLSFALDDLTAAGKNINNLIPESKIRVALYNSSGKVMGPVALSELPILSGSVASKTAVYNLAYGVFQAGSQSANYYLKVWLDSTISESYDGYVVYLKAGVNQETLISKSVHNIKGVVKNASGTAVSGATVTIQEGQVSATTSSTGAFTLSNVPAGLYNITVKHNGNEYRAAMKIIGDTTVSVTSASGYRTSGNSYDVTGVESISTTDIPLNLQFSGTTLSLTKGS